MGLINDRWMALEDPAVSTPNPHTALFVSCERRGLHESRDLRHSRTVLQDPLLNTHSVDAAMDLFSHQQHLLSLGRSVETNVGRLERLEGE